MGEEMNPFEQSARERKCATLAANILAQMVQAIEQATDEMWEASAARAGVNTPSEQSRKRVIEMIKERLNEKQQSE